MQEREETVPRPRAELGAPLPTLWPPPRGALRPRSRRSQRRRVALWMLPQSLLKRRCYRSRTPGLRTRRKLPRRTALLGARSHAASRGRSTQACGTHKGVTGLRHHGGPPLDGVHPGRPLRPSTPLTAWRSLPRRPGHPWLGPGARLLATLLPAGTCTSGPAATLLVGMLHLAGHTVCSPALVVARRPGKRRREGRQECHRPEVRLACRPRQLRLPCRRPAG